MTEGAKSQYGFMVKFAVLLYAVPVMLETVSISPTINFIAEQMPDTSLSMASYAGTISCLTLCLSSLVSSFLTARIRKKALIVAGMVIWVLAGVGNAFMPNIYGIIVMRLIGGFGAGLVISVSSMYIPELWPDEKESTKVTGGFGVATAVWGTLMTPCTAMLCESFGWQGGFAIFLIGVPMLVLQLIFLPNVEIMKFDEAKGEANSKKAKLPLAVLLLLGSGALYAILTTAYFVFCPSLFIEIGIGDATAGSLAMSIETVASFIAGAALATVYSRAKNFTPGICWFLMALGSLVMVVAGNAIIFYVGSFVFGLGYGTYYPYLYAKGALLATPETNDKTMACVNIGYFVGYALATPYLGFLASAFNNETALFSIEATVVTCAVAGVLFIIKAVLERVSAKAKGESNPYGL